MLLLGLSTYSGRESRGHKGSTVWTFCAVDAQVLNSPKGVWWKSYWVHLVEMRNSMGSNWEIKCIGEISGGSGKWKDSRWFYTVSRCCWLESLGKVLWPVVSDNGDSDEDVWWLLMSSQAFISIKMWDGQDQGQSSGERCDAGVCAVVLSSEGKTT